MQRVTEGTWRGGVVVVVVVCGEWKHSAGGGDGSEITSVTVVSVGLIARHCMGL